MTNPVLDLADLGFDAGAHVAVRFALDDVAVGGILEVRGGHRDFAEDLATWCRQNGHRCEPSISVDDPGGGSRARVVRGSAASAAWIGAERVGDGSTPIADEARPQWGLAARGAAIEPGGPDPGFALARRDAVWTDRAPGLYAQALAGQWDPAVAIDWSVPTQHPVVVERAVVQVMTYLIENEEAALVVPARFLGHIHPHFREIQQMLAVTAADEARHIEVFTRRATLGGLPMGLSSVAGRTSLQTLLDEPDFAIASFLLSVMGEGTFVSLLGFLERHAPDAVTRRIAQLVRQDEARHVAFAMSHLERHVRIEPDLRSRLAGAVEQRHRSLQSTAGLADDVFDSLVLLAGGDVTPAALRNGWQRVQQLQQEMAESRQMRLARLGFSAAEAETVASLHTRNFM